MFIGVMPFRWDYQPNWRAKEMDGWCEGGHQTNTYKWMLRKLCKQWETEQDQEMLHIILSVSHGMMDEMMKRRCYCVRTIILPLHSFQLQAHSLSVVCCVLAEIGTKVRLRVAKKW